MQAVKPDIVTILQREGLELRRTGRTLRGKCPLHDGVTATSLSVNPEKQLFHCFGCGSHGDVIAFIQARRKCSFKEALQILGIEAGKPNRPDPVDTKKRELIKDFRIHCRDLSIALARDLRTLRGIVTGIQTFEDMELRAWAYDEIPVIEYKLDLLQYGSDEARYSLYREAMANG